MGEMNGAAECRDQPQPFPGGWEGCRESSASHPRGEGGVFMVLGEGKKISVGLGSDLFIHMFLSSVIMCLLRRGVFIKPIY